MNIAFDTTRKSSLKQQQYVQLIYTQYLLINIHTLRAEPTKDMVDMFVNLHYESKTYRYEFSYIQVLSFSYSTIVFTASCVLGVIYIDSKLKKMLSECKCTLRKIRINTKEEKGVNQSVLYNIDIQKMCLQQNLHHLNLHYPNVYCRTLYYPYVSIIRTSNTP